MEPLSELYLQVTRSEYDWSTYPDFSRDPNEGEGPFSKMEKPEKSREQSSESPKSRRVSSKKDGGRKYDASTRLDSLVDTEKDICLKSKKSGEFTKVDGHAKKSEKRHNLRENPPKRGEMHPRAVKTRIPSKKLQEEYITMQFIHLVNHFINLKNNNSKIVKNDL